MDTAKTERLNRLRDIMNHDPDKLTLDDLGFLIDALPCELDWPVVARIAIDRLVALDQASLEHSLFQD